MANEYATLAQVKSRLDITDTDNDTELESVIEAVSRAIDRDRRTTFYATTATKYYTARWDDWLIIDHLLSVTKIETDDDGDDTHETEWSAGDYYLAPNSAPYTQIYTTNSGDYSFPIDIKRGVKIVGSWGYSATTPPAINEACILMAMRVWKRRDLIFGTAGNAELGTIEAIAPITRDGEIRTLLDTVERTNVG
jgi:hypothetical protein